MRIFYAVNFKEEIKELIYQEILKVNDNNLASFTRKENIHLTIYFVGEIDKMKLDYYIEVLSNIKFNKFEIEVEGFDFFEKKDGKIWFLKVKENLILGDIYKQITKKLSLSQTNYIPHITLARRLKNNQFILKSNLASLKIEVDSISLMESRFVNNKIAYIEIVSKH